MAGVHFVRENFFSWHAGTKSKGNLMHEYLLVFLYIFACNVSDFFRESARKNIGCFERSETVCTVQYVLTPMHARDLIYAPQNSHKFTKERRGVKKSLRPLPLRIEFTTKRHGIKIF